jgi:tRNA pseudouridine55 synthase
MSIGFVVVHKPSGATSHDIVDAMRRITGIRKIGHTGTLDPLATGVLVLAIGKATRLARFVEAEEKEYRAVIQLGVRSDTLDREGALMATNQEELTRIRATLTEAEIALALQHFTGDIDQIPPAFSAVHVDGKRAYELARKGHDVSLPSRKVHIESIELVDFSWPFLTVHISCSKGTYIRSLARDIGDRLGTGALLHDLLRTRVGQFRIEDRVELNEIRPETWTDHLIAPFDALTKYPHLIISNEMITDIVHGKSVRVESDISSDSCFLFSSDHRLVARAEYHTQTSTLTPREVFFEQ